MIIGISGKKNSGKDLVGQIIQYLTSHANEECTFEEYQRFYDNFGDFGVDYLPNWEIKKFADKLKDIVCILIGCTREQLEDREFKETSLGEEWTSYRIARGFWSHSDNNPSHKMMDSQPCDKETYEAEKKINWQTAYKSELTPRLLLQLLGTECGRQIIHPNIWVNATMADYKPHVAPYNSLGDVFDDSKHCSSEIKLPNWLITDVRFPNEYDVVKKHGFLIRVIRPCSLCGGKSYHKLDCGNNYLKEHESETALDKFSFKYTIMNDGTIEDLVRKVREILISNDIL